MGAEERQLLHLILSQPTRKGRPWKNYTFLEVCFGGEHMMWEKVHSPLLPDKLDDKPPWYRHYEFPVDSGWRHLCLRLEAVREDYDVDDDTGRVEVLRADAPHTSSHTAAIGEAQVRLMDALVLGDNSDDEDGVAEKKSRLARLEIEKKYSTRKNRLAIIPATGTLVFYERVALRGWRSPGLGKKPTYVVCGTVDVALYVTEDNDGPCRR
ncbi:hypothetical protein D1007_06755 [Hordeum vulgare]|uniref:Uncharacterized protein n=1 Tax=Hordeum vulgare subsp. vulgare TaxID=112509 RepID=A0A8I6XJ77_HORVV|nr:hypothetical protein D1007_06755 [Hordeum vulgare]KAI4993740.1 hypothetical protein ZWY2020_008053 [Hordeum vulgare]